MSSIAKCYLQRDEEGSIIIDEENNGTVIDENGVPLCRIDLSTIDFDDESSMLNVDGVEYILNLQPPNESPIEGENNEFCWNATTDLLYLDLYEKYKPLIGKRFRTKNKMFSQICTDMRSAPYHYKINEEQVRNHDKTIQRRMKKYFHNTGPKSTGDQRKSILNEKKVLEVYGKQHNITPDYVLSREGESTQEDLFNKATVERVNEAESEDGKGTRSVEMAAGPSTSNQYPPKRVIDVKKREGKTALSLQAMKESIDIQNEFMKQRSEQYEKMIKINEDWARENIRVREEANVERSRRNDLLEQHVQLMKQLLNQQNNDNH